MKKLFLIISLSFLFIGKTFAEEIIDYTDTKLFCQKGSGKWEEDINTNYFGIQFLTKDFVSVFWLKPFLKGRYAEKDGLNYINFELGDYSNDLKTIMVKTQTLDLLIDREEFKFYNNGSLYGSCVKYYKSSIKELFEALVKQKVNEAKKKNKL